MPLVQTEPKSIKIGSTAVKSVYLGSTKVRPSVRTFTITYREQSNMSSGWTYSDDAAGLTAGSTAFDEFFGYSAVKLSSNGTESSKVSQSSAGTLNITQLGTLTSGDNVMIKFPVRGIKMTKSGSVVTLSITDGLGRESEGYQYYAFQNTGDVIANASTTVATKPLYMGAYLSSISGSTLKSWSGQTPISYSTMGDTIRQATNNGTGWTIMGWYQRQLINAYYIMKYGNPDCQSVIGQGYTGGSSYAYTGGTNNQTSATYGTSSTTQQAKLFGLEDWRGNKHQWIGGMFLNNGRAMYVALHDFTGNMDMYESQYKIGGYASQGSYTCLSDVIGDSKAMFLPNGTVSNDNYNTYYCDFVNVGRNVFGCAGGYRYSGAGGGAFSLFLSFGTSDGYEVIGSRLMYI